MNHGLDLGKRLRSLHAVIAYPLEAFGKRMLHHTADNRVHLHRFPFHPLALVRTVVIGDAVAILAVDAPERDRWTHDILGQIPRQTLIPCGHIAFLSIGDNALAITRVTRLDQPLHLLGLHRLPQHREQRPLPLLAQQAIRHVVQMHPLLGLLIPSPTGGDDVQRGIVLAMTAMGLDDQDGAAREGAATDPALDIIHTADATAHEWTQHRLRLLIKRFPAYLRHGQDDMTGDDALMEHLTALADPGVDVDFGASSAQGRLAAHGDAMDALPTLQTAVLTIAHLLRIPAPEHLVPEAIIVTRIVARVDALEPVPVLGKDLFEDVPGRQGCRHRPP